MSNTERAAQINRFLAEAGWCQAVRAPVPGDASTRRYDRLTLNGKKAVLMDAPSEVPIKATSEHAAPDYNVIAKLAANNPAAFTAIAQSLSQRGFRAPQIIAADLPAGLLLLEDLGDALFARVLEETPELEPMLYKGAIDCLAAIYRSSFSADIETFGQSWAIRDYDKAALMAEVDLMLEWYLPYRGAMLSERQVARWHDIWERAFSALESHAPGLVLRDFHAENVFWLDEGEGGSVISRIGLIDFQDGLFGHPAYDLVSLIEDARRDVDPSLADGLIARFCDKAKIKDDASFRAAYAVMGAQRNAKILGIFVRLAKRDGKPSYLNLLSRVENHFMGNIQHEALGELRVWLEEVLK